MRPRWLRPLVLGAAAAAGGALRHGQAHALPTQGMVDVQVRRGGAGAAGRRTGCGTGHALLALLKLAQREQLAAAALRPRDAIDRQADGERCPPQSRCVPLAVCLIWHWCVLGEAVPGRVGGGRRGAGDARGGSTAAERANARPAAGRATVARAGRARPGTRITRVVPPEELVQVPPNYLRLSDISNQIDISIVIIRYSQLGNVSFFERSSTRENLSPYIYVINT